MYIRGISGLRVPGTFGGIGRPFFGGHRPVIGGVYGRGHWGGGWGGRRRWRGQWGGGQFGGGAPDPTVQWAQGCLAQVVDPSVPQDGFLGPQTRQAVQNFQSQQGLPPTGMLDPNTVSALQNACNPQPQPPPPPAPPPPPPQPMPQSSQPQVVVPAGGGRQGGQVQHEAFLGDILGGILNPVGALFGGGGQPAPPPPPIPPPFPFPPPAPFFGGGGEQWGHRWHRPWRREAEAEEFHGVRPVARPGFDFRPEFHPESRHDFGFRDHFPEQRRWDRDRWFHRPGWDWGFGAREERSRILWAQSCLAQVLGSWVLQDGIMGPATAGAIRTFQSQQGLPPTGVLDPPTVSALEAACGSQMPAV